MAVIKTKNLKKYFGKTKAIDGISFAVKKGEIFGFLGPNGAGKTTTIRCMMNFISPTTGSIKILNYDAQEESVQLKKYVGYLSSEAELYGNWNGYEHINLLEKIKGKAPLRNKLIKKLDFNPLPKVKTLSTGNKQKLNLILALMHQPKVIILDEPTAGLDPLLQNTIYGILRELQQNGSTIFMSSHNLHEVENVCTRVGIIKKGKLIATETIADLKKRKIYQAKINFDSTFKKEDFQLKNTKIIHQNSESLILQIKEDINPLLKKLAHYRLKNIEIAQASLEEIFLEFYKNKK